MKSEEHSRGNAERSGRPGSLVSLWLTALLFIVLSSVLFSFLFEWQRYRIIMSVKAHGLTILDEALLFWLLVAKSLAWFLPVLLLYSVLIALKRNRTAIVVLNGSLIAICYFMAVDLAWVGFTSHHTWEYWRPVGPIIADPWNQIPLWAGENLTADTGFVVGVFVILGLANFMIAGWVTKKLSLGRGAGRPAVATAGLMAAYGFVILGAAPCMGLFSDRYALDRVFSALPLSRNVRASLAQWPPAFSTRLKKVDVESVSAWPFGPGHSAKARSTGHSERDRRLSRFLGPDRRGHESPGEVEIGRDEMLARRVAADAVDPGPVDTSAFVVKPNLPNVVLIIFESFRHTALNPHGMRELAAWAQQGLQLERHHSGSNCSHLGLFSLFYGRSALGYSQTLDRKIPPQLLESLRRSGYRTTFVTSGEIQGFRRVREFLNPTYCDDIAVEGEFRGEDMRVWPDSDGRKLTRLKSILNSTHHQPQFVFFYLLSSHWPYPFPPEFEAFKESSRFRQFFDPWSHMQSQMNRYANSLLFLDHELMNLLKAIDLERNVVIITGDHGESMGDDGVFRHGTRSSQIQLRVPCVIVGAGVKSQRIRTATAHPDLIPTLLHILAGRSIPVRQCQGRDLLADPAPADQVALVPSRGAHWEGVLIIRGSRRMLFRTDTGSGSTQARFVGLVDASGQYQWKVPDDRGTGSLPEIE